MPAKVLVITAAAGVPDAAAAGLGPLRRLADTAVEVELGGPLPVGFAAPGCDVNLVPGQGRRKRVLVADMDSTIIGVECIDELADFAGLKAEVATITEAAMRGELDFESALVARVKLLEGLPAATLEACYAERVRLFHAGRLRPRPSGPLEDPDGLEVEAFDLSDNLMMHGAILSSGAEMQVGEAPAADRYTALDAFERCLAIAARLMKAP